ncbi:hypothetical protein BDY21DRAFT_86108 [Lineolata rhizophorae]|uniref:Uncharacterized protein n=1 Tax=Lineolata rhizophorae TaxID=578093 RepID=A0A6A6PBU6_9PEZI|nr:hypothetical protein BDY21DRAFT_86108 [Lineolata rhizophorae]
MQHLPPQSSPSLDGGDASHNHGCRTSFLFWTSGEWLVSEHTCDGLSVPLKPFSWPWCHLRRLPIWLTLRRLAAARQYDRSSLQPQYRLPAITWTWNTDRQPLVTGEGSPIKSPTANNTDNLPTARATGFNDSVILARCGDTLNRIGRESGPKNKILYKCLMFLAGYSCRGRHGGSNAPQISVRAVVYPLDSSSRHA